ncbi:MAG TPA: hypothetical protein VN680_10375 [Burkholderiaceae bacterium]|jgi:hypothetical protein|nr:hypothetical protein [Burkholderiaceae bacterium]
MLIKGSCHCRNIAFALDWRAPSGDIPARACTCSFCTKHGGVWTSSPQALLKVSVRDTARLTRYQFGTRTALFHVCSNCGVVPLVTSEIDGNTYAVVSVNAFEDVDAALLKRASASFDGEGVGDRLARRKRNWIAQVEFVDVLEPG